jgi:hypothetical protein
MTTELFSDPTQPGLFKPEQWVGHLLLCEPERYLEQVMTQYGVSDAVEGTVTVLTAQPAPEVIEGARVFQGVLIATLRPAIGRLPVLGRLALGQPKGNQSPPYLLQPANDQDRAFAEQYLRTRPSRTLAQPPQQQPVQHQYPVPQQSQYPVAQVPLPGAQQPQAQPYAGQPAPGYPQPGPTAVQPAQQPQPAYPTPAQPTAAPPVQQQPYPQPGQQPAGTHPLGPPPVVHGTPVYPPAQQQGVQAPVQQQPAPAQATTVTADQMAHLPPDVQRLLTGGSTG